MFHQYPSLGRICDMEAILVNIPYYFTTDMDEIIKLVLQNVLTIIAGGIATYALKIWIENRNKPARDAAAMMKYIEHLQTRVGILENESRVKDIVVARLMAQIVKMGGTPVNVEDVVKEQEDVIEQTAASLSRVVHMIESTYSADELTSLLFDMGVEAGIADSGPIKNRAQALVAWTKNRNRMVELVKIIWRQRPHLF